MSVVRRGLLLEGGLLVLLVRYRFHLGQCGKVYLRLELERRVLLQHAAYDAARNPGADATGYYSRTIRGNRTKASGLWLT